MPWFSLVELSALTLREFTLLGFQSWEIRFFLFCSNEELFFFFFCWNEELSFDLSHVCTTACCASNSNSSPLFSNRLFKNYLGQRKGLFYLLCTNIYRRFLERWWLEVTFMFSLGTNRDFCSYKSTYFEGGNFIYYNEMLFSWS